jgi:DNA polymerase-3 subunit gamma/tau
MPAQALYRKWRPQLWEEVVGQDPIVQTLRNALRAERIAHAYLFSGPRGCGKTTSARLVAKALNCLHPDPAQRPDNTCDHCVAVTEGRFLDLIEIDGASNNGVDNIRELREKINFAPGQGRYKVYIIDEVHMLSTGAFNALLKTLEEPPPHAVFILATTENYKIPATVSSRCQRFEFRRIPVSEMVSRLRRMCDQEGIEYEVPALELVARQATGSLRDAISLLDQLVGAGTTVTLAQAQDLLGASASQQVQHLVDALAASDLTAGLEVINGAVDAGVDPRQMARQVVDHLRNLMLVRLGNAALVEATPEARAALARQAERLPVPALLRAMRAFNAAANDNKGGWQPQLPLELAAVECTAPLTAPEPAEVVPAAASARPTTSAPEMAAPEPPAPRRAAPEAPARPPRAEAAPTRQPPPARVAPPQAPPDEGASGSGRSVAEFKAEWNRLLKTLRDQDKPTEALLRSCTLVGLDGSLLRLSTSEFIYNRMQSDADTRGRVDALVSQVFGQGVVVRYEVAGKRGADRRSDDIPQDGLVATALDLGGEIVE